MLDYRGIKLVHIFFLGGYIMSEKKVFKLTSSISKIMSVLILVFLILRIFDLDFQSRFYVLSFIAIVVTFILAIIIRFSIVIRKM